MIRSCILLLLFFGSINVQAKATRVHTVLDRHGIQDLLNSYKNYFPASSSRIVNTKYNEIIEEKCKKYGVQPKLVHAVIKQESGYNPRARSRAGAVGIMQLMPDTAKRFGVTDRYDAPQNIDGGIRYLKFLTDLFHDLKLAIAGYNAGENAVIKYGYNVPPYPETKNYVKIVLATYNRG